MTRPTDAELWRRIRADDPEAFAALFRRHGPTIHRFALRRTGDPHHAEDVAAGVFLEAWRRRATVELHQPSALPWLYGVATNLLHRWRRERRQVAAIAERLHALPAPDPLLVERQVEAAAEARRLLALLPRLPRRQLDVWILATWEGLSMAEIAVALDLPCGTVKSRLSRARARRARAAGPAEGRAEPRRVGRPPNPTAVPFTVTEELR